MIEPALRKLAVEGILQQHQIELLPVLPGMPSLEVVKHRQLCLLRKINLCERCHV